MSDIAEPASRQPALFLAHGNPMNALADNDFTRSLTRLAETLDPPDAILVVSAHWETNGTRVTGQAAPPMIHDFGGFPRELYEVQYPALGAPALAEEIAGLLGDARTDSRWGLDHASWTVLRHMWPRADVPVIELSLDAQSSTREHWDLGERLAPLRDRGVLVIGSGNIVHSFAGIDWSEGASPHPWAEEFDAWVADACITRDAGALVDYRSAGLIARLALPTDEHYLPLLYAAAMADESDEVTFPYTGIDMASMSMRCVRFG
jgi:4,5-DOPA dioxygenase extradiol